MTDSFFLTRLKNFYENSANHNQIRQGQIWNSGYLNGKPLHYTSEMRMTEISYTEEEHKGHQIIIRKEVMQYAFLLKNGERGNFWGDEINLITERSEWQTETTYRAYAWKIRDLDVEPAILGNLWDSRHYLFGNNYTTKSLKQTTTKAKKRVDIEAVLFERKSILNELSENRTYRSNTTAPYNLKVNDWVWIQAHGRLRNGIIVGTEGRRFIVGYTTPSNLETLKYKVLNLSQIYVVEGDLIETQSHNFVKVGA